MIDVFGVSNRGECMNDDDWFFVMLPRVQPTKSVMCTVDDHLGKSDIMIDTWWSGEGFTLRIESDGEKREMDVSWQEWEAIKRSIDAIDSEGQ